KGGLRAPPALALFLPRPHGFMAFVCKSVCSHAQRSCEDRACGGTCRSGRVGRHVGLLRARSTALRLRRQRPPASVRVHTLLPSLCGRSWWSLYWTMYHLGLPEIEAVV